MGRVLRAQEGIKAGFLFGEMGRSFGVAGTVDVVL
jgi:hypothetical protein